MLFAALFSCYYFYAHLNCYRKDCFFHDGKKRFRGSSAINISVRWRTSPVFVYRKVEASQLIIQTASLFHTRSCKSWNSTENSLKILRLITAQITDFLKWHQNEFVGDASEYTKEILLQFLQRKCHFGSNSTVCSTR